MKQKLKAVLAVAIASVGVAALSVSGAQAVNSENYIKVDEGSVNSSETEVNHSLTLVGNNVTSSDKVDGILFALGNNVTVKGSNEYGVLGGSTVDVTNTITKDLFVGGGVVNINKDAKIGRDLYAAGGVVNVNTDIKGNAFIAASTVKLSNVKVEGDLNVYAQVITYDGTVTVKGKVNYNKDARVDGKVEGQTDAYEAAAMSMGVQPVGYGEYALTVIISTISLLITAIVIHAIFPGIHRKLAGFFKEMKASTMIKNIVFGLCALIVVPILAILLLLTIVGMPLALIALGFYVLCIYLATAATGAYLGHLILTKAFKAKPNVYLELVIGIILLGLIALIPVVGWIIGVLAVLFGIGLILALITTRKAKK